MHHLLRAEHRGTGHKTGDEWCVPLCCYHHDELHGYGNEVEYFAMQDMEFQSVKGWAVQLCMSSPCRKIRGIYGQ